MKKTRKHAEIREIQAPVKSIMPQFCNVSSIYTHEDFVILDFGFFAPPYSQKSDYYEDTQIARICLPWDSTEELSRTLASVVESRANKGKKKRPKSSKA